MMAKRYELNDQQWARIADLLPGKKSDPGRTAKDNRLFVNGVLWVLRSGAQWDELPERYGKWKSVHKRFTRWAKNGVWERVFAALIDDPKNAMMAARPSTRVCTRYGTSTRRGASTAASMADSNCRSRRCKRGSVTPRSR
jgi:transposase